jgi:NTE family protein
MAASSDREPGVGLALSGGGFRATLYMLGSLWRLNELGWLPKLTRVTSVSGASITAGVLGLKWKRLRFDPNQVATNFVREVAAPLREFCARHIDISSGIAGLMHLGKSINDIVVGRYNKHLFHHATLQDLPDEGEGPRFVIYATSLQSGAGVRFSRPYLADYKVGRIDQPLVPLAFAVGASSAFPPVLSPAVMKCIPGQWKEMKGAFLFEEKRFRERMVLTDGGVYDNMGLETIWQRYETVLVSDAGAPNPPDHTPSRIWHRQLTRTLHIITEQARALRKRQLIAAFKAGHCQGSYWGITTHIDDYELPNAMTTDNEITHSLQTIRTRLNHFSPEEQGRLINWGYALTDAAMRRHVLPSDPGPGRWPVPDYALDRH